MDVIGSTIGESVSRAITARSGAAARGARSSHIQYALNDLALPGAIQAETASDIVVTGILPRRGFLESVGGFFSDLASDARDLLFSGTTRSPYERDALTLQMTIGPRGRSWSAPSTDLGHVSATASLGYSSLRGTLSHYASTLPMVRSLSAGRGGVMAGVESRMNSDDPISASIAGQRGSIDAFQGAVGTFGAAAVDLSRGVAVSPVVFVDEGMRGAAFAFNNPGAAIQGTYAYVSTPSRWAEGTRQNFATGNAFGVGIDGGAAITGALAGSSMARALSGATVGPVDVLRDINPRFLLPRQGPAEMTGNRIRRITSDMRQNGFDRSQPIIAADVNGRLIIVDGHHRTDAAIRAGISDVPVSIRSVSPEQAARLAAEAAEAMGQRGLRWR